MVFEQLNLTIDEEELKRQFEETKARFENSIEPGEYIGILNDIEFKINPRDYKPIAVVKFSLGLRNYSYTYTLSHPSGIYFFIKFLNQIDSTKEATTHHTFDGFQELEHLTSRILLLRKGTDYKIKIGKNKNNFDTLDVINK